MVKDVGAQVLSVVLRNPLGSAEYRSVMVLLEERMVPRTIRDIKLQTLNFKL